MLDRRSARAAVLVVICGGALIGPGETMAASGTPLAASAAMTANARVTAKVNALGGLSVRTGPGTGHRRVTVLGNGVRLRVVCRVGGETVAGSARRTAVWDRLSNGRYVSDAYVVWRPARPRLALCSHRAAVRAAAAGSLNVRRTASTGLARTGILRHGTRLSVVCQLAGEHVNGPVRRTAVWDRLSNGRFVSDAFVGWKKSRPAVPWCRMGGAKSPEAHGAFITWAARQARPWSKRYGVPVSVSVAQAILESGWGDSALTQEGNAYFGAKCFGGGPIAVGCRPYHTYECARGGECFGTSATFRVYRRASDSFRDHDRALAMLSRYDKAFKYTHNPNRFAKEVHRAGYATSPRYARSLIKLMRQYHLYRYDIRRR